MAFSCDAYCTTVDAYNAAYMCNAFDCSMTCPNALTMFETQGCSAEGVAAFDCIKDTPEASWACDPMSNELIYQGSECSAEVQLLIDCQMM
jgi:hypothetical protein